MCSLVQKKSVAHTIVKPVLSNTGFIVPIAKTVGKTVESAVDEFHLLDMEKESSTVDREELSIVRQPPHVKRPSKIISDNQ